MIMICTICGMPLPYDEYAESRQKQHNQMHPNSKTNKNFINKYGKEQQWIIKE